MARSKYSKHSDANTDAPDASASDAPTAGASPSQTPPDAPEFVSRSAKKRESEAMKALGMALAELSPKQLEELQLSERLLTAITDYQKITSNSAKRRQRSYIGGLLREDADAANAIRERHQALTEHDANAKRTHHELEDWRERLIADDSALTDFLNAYSLHDPSTQDAKPEVSVQELRGMIRRARTAKDDAQRKKATRALYRKLASIAQA